MKRYLSLIPTILIAVTITCFVFNATNSHAQNVKSETPNLPSLAELADRIAAGITNADAPPEPAQTSQADQPVEVTKLADASNVVKPAASTQTTQPAQTDTSSFIAQPASDGVIPSIVFKEGDITNFIKIVSMATNKNIVPSRLVKGPITVNLFNVTLNEALDAVLPAYGFTYEENDSFIMIYTKKELDAKIAAARKTEHRIFNLNYIPASDVQTLITPLLSADGRISTSPDAGTAATGTGETWAGSNYIILNDYPEHIEKIEKLIKNVDVRPPQVLIEATILVASLDDTNELGVDLTVLGGLDFRIDSTTGAKIGVIADSSVGTDQGGDTSFSSTVGAGGLSIGITNNNVGIFIRALESTTDVIALGNPKVLTLNRQQGKVIVGNEDGYITTEVSQTTSTQTVEFLETGTQLTFRPFVMNDGYIRMELEAEDSDGGVEVVSGLTLPAKTTANVNSNILVKDGSTIVLGGLFRERTSLTRGQVPLLGNIPLVGHLFRSTSDQNTKEEVIFLITPHIVEDSIDYAAADETMDNCNRLMLGAREGMMGTARTRLASAYYQAARQNQTDGKMELAMWNADLATHVSPMLLDAQKLRDQLRTRKLYLARSSSMQTFMTDLIEKKNEKCGL